MRALRDAFLLFCTISDSLALIGRKKVDLAKKKRPYAVLVATSAKLR